MAIVAATKTGVWSDTTVWSTGALPGVADDVQAGGFTVTINISPTVLSISNSAGGSFVPTNGITLTCTAALGLVGSGNCFVSSLTSGQSCILNANCVAGSATAILNTSSGSITINGYVQGGSAAAAYGLNNSSSGTVNVFGDVRAGSINGICWGANNTGTLNVTGNVYHIQSNGFQNYVINNSGTLVVNGNVTCTNGNSGYAINNTGILTVTGNITTSTAVQAINSTNTTTINGSITTTSSGTGFVTTSNATITGTVTSAGSGSGVINNGGGTITITGTATGGSSTGVAYYNASTGTINHTGNATAGSASAFFNNSTGTITHIGTAQASASAAAIGGGSVGQNTILTGPLLSTDQTYTGGATASGVNPCIALRWFPKETALATPFYYQMRSQTVATTRATRTLYFPEAFVAGYPLPANVRRSTTYGPTGIYVGTCYIPDPANVAYGVAVDATTGTLTVPDLSTVWAVPLSSLTVPGSIGERLKNIATTSSVSQAIRDVYR